MKFSWISVFEYSLSRIIPAFINFGVVIIYTRLFPPEEFGKYILILSIVSLLSLFSTSFLRPVIVRFYAHYQNKNKVTVFFSTVILIYLAFSIIFTLGILILYLLGNIQNYYWLNFIHIIILLFILTSFFESFIHIFRVENKSKSFSFFWGIYVLFRHSFAILLCLLFNPTIKNLFIGFLIGTSLIDSILLSYLLRKYSFKLNLVEIVDIKLLLKFGLPLVFSNAAFWTLTYFDRFLIEWFRSSEELGVYGLGFSVSENGLRLIFSSLMLHVYPVLSHVWESESQDKAENLLSDLSENYLLIALPVFWVISLLSKDIVKILAPESYLRSFYIIPMIAYSYLMLGFSEYVAKGFEMTKNTKYIARIAFGVSLFNLMLNIILIPFFGFVGAGLSLMVSTTFYLILSILKVKKFFYWKISIRYLMTLLVLNLFLIFIIYFLISFISFSWLRIIVALLGTVVLYFIFTKKLGLIKFI